MIYRIQFIKNSFEFKDLIFWNKLVKEVLNKENLIKQGDKLELYAKRVKCKEFKAIETLSKFPLTEIQAQIIIEKLKEKYDVFALRTNGENLPKINVPKIDNKFMNEELAKLYHNSWLNRKIQEGWRYGRVYSELEKTHPMILPWEQLPDRLKHIDNLYDKISNILGVK